MTFAARNCTRPLSPPATNSGSTVSVIVSLAISGSAITIESCANTRISPLAVSILSRSSCRSEAARFNESNSRISTSPWAVPPTVISRSLMAVERLTASIWSAVAFPAKTNRSSDSTRRSSNASVSNTSSSATKNTSALLPATTRSTKISLNSPVAVNKISRLSASALALASSKALMLVDCTYVAVMVPLATISIWPSSVTNEASVISSVSVNRIAPDTSASALTIAISDSIESASPIPVCACRVTVPKLATISMS